MLDHASITDKLSALLDAGGVLTDPARTAPMLRDHRALYRGHALAVVAPADTAAVSAGATTASAWPRFSAR